MITLSKGERPQTDEHGKRPHLAHWIRWLSVPIILFWIAMAVLVNVIAPMKQPTNRRRMCQTKACSVKVI